MKLALRTCVEWMGGEYAAPGDEMAQGYSIDTRTLRPGELFFCRVWRAL